MSCRRPKNTMNPDQFYGRATEIAVLRSALQKSASGVELVIIEGPSGTGKTALGRTLRTSGNFVSGTFCHDEPYSAFLGVFQQFADLIVSQGEAKVESTRNAIEQATTQVRLLTDTFPALERILGTQGHENANYMVRTTDTQHNSSHYVFSMFMRAISPLIILLDGLEYACEASLTLLQALAADTDNRGLLIVATVDTSKVTEPLMLQELDVTRIELANMDRSTVAKMLAERSGGVDDIHGLTHFVYDHTRGNPLFIHYLLDYMLQEGLLQSNGDKWQWNQLPQQPVASVVAELLDLKIQQLPASIQNVLKTAAALGSTDAKLLKVCMKRTCSSSLSFAQQEGLLVGNEFAHEAVRQAAYSLIPATKHDLFHLTIGRKLWNKYSESDLHLFLIVGQLRRGVELVSDPHEQCAMATLFLRAGKKAMRSSAFKEAVVHLGLALDVLGLAPWWYDDRYEICREVHNALAEAYYVTADFESMHVMLDALFHNAKSFCDKLQAYTTLVYAYGAQHYLQKAVETAFDVLRQLGETFPSRPGKLRVFFDLIKTQWMLRGKGDQFLTNLPVATDPDKIAAMQMLNFAFSYAYTVRPEYAALAIFRLMRLSVQHGVSGTSTAAFCGYGFILCASFGATKEAYRYGQLALSLLERLEARAWLPRVYNGVYGYINQWSTPLRECCAPLKLAHQVALETGDVESSMFAACLYLQVAFNSGLPLEGLEQEARAYCFTMARYGQTIALAFTVPFWSFLSNLIGTSSSNLLLPAVEITDEDSAVKHALKENNTAAVTMHYNNCVIYHCLCGDYETSVKMAERCRKTVNETNVSLVFYEGLAALAIASTAKGLKRYKYGRVGRKCANQMKLWARQCPANFLNKKCLLEAELSALKGNHICALLLYNKSIELAEKEGFQHEEAIAYERLGRYFHLLQYDHVARPYCRLAHSKYGRWGSQALTNFHACSSCCSE